MPKFTELPGASPPGPPPGLCPGPAGGLKFKDNQSAKIQRQSVMNPNLCVCLMYIFCAKYFSSHLELNCKAKLISYSDILSDYVRTMPL